MPLDSCDPVKSKRAVTDLSVGLGWKSGSDWDSESVKVSVFLYSFELG